MLKFFCNKIPAFNCQDCLKNALYITSDYSFIPKIKLPVMILKTRNNYWTI